MAATKRQWQEVGDPKLHRADHVWFKLPDAEGYKCCLCGGVAAVPPPYPTPEKWVPERFELPLTARERALCPDIYRG